MPEKKGNKTPFKGLSLMPFVLTVLIVVSDRLTKNWVVANIPRGTVWRSFFGDFLWICHVRNTGVAFSMGNTLPSPVRMFLFTVLPIVVMLYMVWLVADRRSSLSTAQRWLTAGVLGGGIGTTIDRILFFEEGVVDFISIKFYGLFGLDRWPTFNISDSCVVVFVIILAITILFSDGGKKA